MTQFDARLRLPGHTRIPVSVVVDISSDRLKFDQGDTALASWPIEGIVVEARPDGFHIKFHEEEVILNVEEAQSFAGELARAKNPGSETEVDVPAAETYRSGNMFERLNGVDPEDLFATVKARIAELRESLVDQSVEPGMVFAQWIRLLKEINVRHGQGAMPTPLFYRLNTELLDLLPVPPVARESAEPLAAT